MRHHEDAHQGGRLLLVGVAVLVVSSGIASTGPAPRPHVTPRELGTVTLLCTTSPVRATIPTPCRVVIHTPIR
jgi:hypothetical protein